METTGLLVELAVVLVAATAGAVIAIRLGASPIVGYIVAGVAIGPYTPGLVSDAELVRALADIGVVFLMFAIGARISLPDLARVGRVATLGGVIQVSVMLAAGYLVGLAVGLAPLEALFLGAVVSNSSSTVLAKLLDERGETETEHGHTALAWSTVQDLGTIGLIIVLTSLSTSSGELVRELPEAIVLAAAFLVIALVVGARVVPAAFEHLASFRNREVFVLGVAAMALGTAWAASLFGVSLAIGAFLAGVVVSQTDLSSRVVGEALPFRDLFAGVFFVSIGMLVDPGGLFRDLPTVLLVLLLIIGLKAAVVSLVARGLGRPWRSAIVTGALLAQCAEFSFLMARLGTDVGALSDQAFSLMLGAAATSVVLAPAVFSRGHRLGAWVDRRAKPEVTVEAPVDPGSRPWAVVCGYGRVGRVVCAALEQRGLGYRVVEEDRRIIEELRSRGIPSIRGSAANRATLDVADLGSAGVLIIALPDPYTVRTVVLETREIAPTIPIVARTHRPQEREALLRMGVNEVVVGEIELGFEMTRLALGALGEAADTSAAVIGQLREGELHAMKGVSMDRTGDT